MVFVFRHREARQLDSGGDALLVDERNGRKAFPDKDLPPLDVIGHQIGVGRPARGRHCIAGGVNHEMVSRVTGADATHISDVVVQRCPDGMAPIAGRYGPLEAPAAQNVLDAKGDHGRVFAIVIKRVAAGDALDDEPGGLVQAVGNVRLSAAKDPAVGLGQVSTLCVR